MAAGNQFAFIRLVACVKIIASVRIIVQRNFLIAERGEHHLGLLEIVPATWLGARATREDPVNFRFYQCIARIEV